MHSCAKFPSSFVWKPEHATPIDAEPNADFNANWPLKVIQVDVIEKLLSDYILR